MAIFDEKGLFLRDLSEVHLLFDFISGRAGKTLDRLGGTFKVNVHGKPFGNLTSAEVVEEICKIGYPPTGKLEANAEEAAFLVVVKDKLNDLAHPARGLTIAFTGMFAGTAIERQTFWEYLIEVFYIWTGPQGSRKTEKRRPWIGTLFSLSTDRSGLHPQPDPVPIARRVDPEGANAIGDAPLSSYTAVLAFPSLVWQARRFRRFFNQMPAWGGVIVLVIAVVSWDCSVTSGLLNNVASAKHDRDALFSNEALFIPTDKHCAPLLRDGSTPKGAGSKTEADEREQTHQSLICAHAKALSEEAKAVGANLRAVEAGIGWRHPLYSLMHPVALGVAAYKAGISLRPTNAERPESEHADEQAQSQLEGNYKEVLNAFNTLLTPLLFGWLGTIIGVARSITSKVRDSILAPRDYQVAKVSMLLGMSAGLTVGLFLSPIEAKDALTKSLGGTISITAATLSFLAGLGSEAFFNFADSVIGRIFPSTPPLIKDDPPRQTR